MLCLPTIPSLKLRGPISMQAVLSSAHLFSSEPNGEMKFQMCWYLTCCSTEVREHEQYLLPLSTIRFNVPNICLFITGSAELDVEGCMQSFELRSGRKYVHDCLPLFSSPDGCLG